MITVAMGRGTVDGVVGVCRETGVGCAVAVTNGEYEIGGSRDGCGSAEKTEWVGVSGVVGGGRVVEGWWVYVVYWWGLRWIYGGFWRLVGRGWVSGRVLVGFSGGCKMGGEWKGGQNERRGGRNERRGVCGCRWGVDV